MSFDAKAWHTAVKKVYQSSPGYLQYAKTAPCGGRIIPLCTPIPEEVDVVVIGLNHAAFYRNYEEAERIAEAFTNDVPVVNTYLVHNHSFARNLRTVAGKAGIEVTERWIGTNWCPIQTGNQRFSDIFGKNPPLWLMDAANYTTKLLKDLVKYTSPKCVILSGEYAAKIYYPSTFKVTHECRPSIIKTAKGHAVLVPVPHISMDYHLPEVIHRLQTCVKPILEGEVVLRRN